jgi:hypothetical protein
MNRLSKPLFSVVALLALAALACLSNGGGTQPPGASIGKVSLVDDQVEHNNNPLSGIEDLKGNDSIKVFDAGEGLLDFGGDLILRMFNTTSLGGITVASSSDSPLDVRMALESGGFTGDKVKPGGKAVFTTPNGAKITVYGTSFFVVYDPDSGVTTAGNFNGRMEIEAGGSGPLPIPENHSRRVEPGGQPGPETPLPFDRGGFEQRARDLASPVVALVQVEIIQPEPIPVDTTPPYIELLAIDPQPIAIGGECPGASGTTQITAQAFDDGGVSRVVAFWSINQQSAEVLLERIDDVTFTGTIGPVESLGSLAITLTAWDNAGNGIDFGPLYVEVVSCIG